MSYEVDWPQILGWLGKSQTVWIKKLSRNDCSWADDRDKHQAGFYVPHDIRAAGFFPALSNVNADKSHIFEALIQTVWPETGELKLSRVVHYSNKGPETHLTRLPREQFAGLTPASILVMGSFEGADGPAWWALVVDSASETASVLETFFDLDSNFHSILVNPADFISRARDENEMLIEELTEALKCGTLASFIASAALPATETLALMAQEEFLRGRSGSLNPFELDAPGNAVMEISRDIEYRLYRRAEMRHRAAEVLRILTSQGGSTDIATSVVRGFSDLNATFLSASQHRKSRAGMSFEHHIRRMLEDGGVRYQAQAVTGGRRPDFVMPDGAALGPKAKEHGISLVLSAKTTLRERWKQITLERFASPIFLATVDDRISDDAIIDMSAHSICLVVPESLKESDYDKHGNVITFAQFFRDQVRDRRPALIRAPVFHLT
ncbi:hypothetical protein HIV01_015740 [Lysobacter arenosi]|uniref:Restriction endonuclease type II EcoRII C-terminal domain-containing protein n=1 Tax=Lysobacter arenosi TaxID=2795387 RepID=A0ABX7R9F1_9GAMM|nr:type II restriction endonuclease [Lysobacter arenosi]QSX74610.1 hypothetical protein HIV01_015740 [Lysobacter arenosi]